ncbi:hypothetical protein AT6N2_C0760 [Agrobacterium tumefaciens]|nr:hypothetical protein AT6N2_C0760 [Agrobacterium tumefaciens]
MRLVHTVGAFEAVGAEEVALRLDEVRAAAAAAIGVEIAECGSERRNRQAGEHGVGNHPAQRRVGVLDDGGERRRHDEVRHMRILGEGRGDLIEEFRTDDAACAPDAGNRGHRQVPVELLGGGRHDGEALRVGTDLGGQKRVFQIGDEGLLVSRCRRNARQAKNLLGSFALVLLRRQDTGSHGRLDGGCGDAHVLGFDDRPLAGALLAGLVEDQIDHRLTGDRIGGAQNLLGDFDQVGIQTALVPLAKDISDFGGTHLQTVTQDAIDFGDHLHVGIFDAVMDRLDEVASAVIAEPCHARIVIILGGDGRQNLLDALPALLGAADHDRRAVARTFFTTGNAHADEGQAAILQIVEAADRIAEVRITGVDHDIAVGQMRLQDFHLLVNRVAGLDHDDDRARRTNGGNEFLDGFARDQLSLQCPGFSVEFFRRFRGSVEYGDLVAFFGDVERQVRAHDAETDQTDFCLFHGCASILLLGGRVVAP